MQSGARELPPGNTECTISKPAAIHATAVEHRARVALARQRRGEPEHDLGLDARLVQAVDVDRRGAAGRLHDGAVPHHRPHRPVDAVARPDRAVGEADLAADRAPALRDAPRVQRGERLVAALDVEVRIAVGHRLDLRAAVGGREQPVDDARHRLPGRSAAPTIHSSVATTMPMKAATSAIAVPVRPSDAAIAQPMSAPRPPHTMIAST